MRIKDLKQNDQVRIFGSTGTKLAWVQRIVTDMTHYRDVAYVTTETGYEGVLTDNDEWLPVTKNIASGEEVAKRKREKDIRNLYTKLKDKQHIENVTKRENEERDNKQQQDIVNRPSHYTYGDIEVIDFVEQVTASYPPELGFAVGNAIKYISRAQHKNGKQDIEKARYYVNRIFEKWEDK